MRCKNHYKLNNKCIDCMILICDSAIRCSDCNYKNMSNVMTGKKRSLETCKKISENHKGMTGKKHSLEARKKCSMSKIREKNPAWKNGVKDFGESLRDSFKYKLWRNNIFSRDNFTCCDCNNKSSGNLEAHHKIPLSVLKRQFLNLHPQLNWLVNKEILLKLAFEYLPLWDETNGVTICTGCHLIRTKTETTEILIKEKIYGSN